MDDRGNNVPSLPPPPGIIGSLRAGFDVVATHIAAILLPAAFDVFLWLGPHVRVDQLLLRSFQGMPLPAGDLGVLPSAQSINLLAALRTFPVGVASLMVLMRPLNTPWGTPPTVEVGSFLGLFLWGFALTLAGWFCGGLYFRWVAALVAAESVPNSWRALVQTLVYSVIWSILFWVIGVPVFLFLLGVWFLNQAVGMVLILMLGFLSTWLIVPIFFSPHGMYLRKQNALASILGSLQMSRLTLPTSSLFVLLVLLISYLLNQLWIVASPDSWLALVGILGHAFIATALLAASFVYYHDTTLWIQMVRERLRAGLPTRPA